MLASTLVRSPRFPWLALCGLHLVCELSEAGRLAYDAMPVSKDGYYRDLPPHDWRAICSGGETHCRRCPWRNLQWKPEIAEHCAMDVGQPILLYPDGTEGKCFDTYWHVPGIYKFNRQNLARLIDHFQLHAHPQSAGAETVVGDCVDHAQPRAEQGDAQRRPLHPTHVDASPVAGPSVATAAH